MYLFDKCDLSFMSCTAITLKFKMHWFPNEGCYWAGKLKTNFGVTCIQVIGLFTVANKNPSTSWDLNPQPFISSWKLKPLSFFRLYDEQGWIWLWVQILSGTQIFFVWDFIWCHFYHLIFAMQDCLFCVPFYSDL